MEFCAKCGSVMIVKDKKGKCAKCGYSPKGKMEISAKEILGAKKQVAVVKDKDTDVFPVINANCRKCGNQEAYFWTTQTRAGDEAETRFFRCTKCRFTWREYK